MKPLFYLLLVICFSTIFSCKKEKIAQTPTPASPTTIVPNATEQQLVGVWRFVKQEIYDNNVLVWSFDSTLQNSYDSILLLPFIPTNSDYIEFTNVNNFGYNPQIPYMFYNYNLSWFALTNYTNAFYVTLSGQADPTNSLINTSTYDSFSRFTPSWPCGIDPNILSFILPNSPPITTNQLNSINNASTLPEAYIRVLDAHNLVVSNWGNNYADGYMIYLCR